MWPIDYVWIYLEDRDCREAEDDEEEDDDEEQTRSDAGNRMKERVSE